MSTLPFLLHGPHITLAHAVKAVGLADSGGHAKSMVREGLIHVNNELETKPARKLSVADRFGTLDQEWIVEQSE